MNIPVQPRDFFAKPFASEGTYKIIPENKVESGRASLALGFPTETQLPVSHGGVAPNRMDFNGILYMLSSFAFWQQSGGQWIWSDVLNYTPPSFVYHRNAMWWCVAPTGPETEKGIVEPGTDTAFWVDFYTHLAATTESKTGDFTPVGTVIMYHSANTPEGYLPCNGSAFSATAYPVLFNLLGRAATPDFRGCFIRGYDPAGSRDPDGTRRVVGSTQNDAVFLGSSNATSWIKARCNGNTAHDWRCGGPVVSVSDFGGDSTKFGGSNTMKGGHSMFTFNFNALSTATETRPKNASLLFCIKHD